MCYPKKWQKIVHQQKCVVEGYEYGNVYGGGYGYTFKPIKGYGKISVDSGTNALQDDKGEVIVSKDGTVEWGETEFFIKDKDAFMRNRHPNFGDYAR